MPAGSVLAAGVLAALAATWRIERVWLPASEPRALPTTPCIFALWHSRLLPLVWTHRAQRIGMLVSRHRDGEWIARVIRHLGYAVARGSSTRGAEEGLREMLAFADAGHGLGLTPDGPRGPARLVKPGVVYLASRTGLPVVPIASAANRAWEMRSWDGFRVPKPFARVVVATAAPIAVPADLDDAGRESWRLTIQRKLDGVTDAADALAGARA